MNTRKVPCRSSPPFAFWQHLASFPRREHLLNAPVVGASRRASHLWRNLLAKAVALVQEINEGARRRDARSAERVALERRRHYLNSSRPEQARTHRTGLRL